MLVTPDGRPCRATPPPIRSPATSSRTATSSIIVTARNVLQGPVATTQFTTLSNLDAAADGRRTFATSVQIYRLARCDARGDDHLHEHRPRRLGLRRHGARRRNHRRHRRDALSIRGTGTVAFDATGVLTEVERRRRRPTSTIAGPAWANGAAATELRRGISSMPNGGGRR